MFLPLDDRIGFMTLRQVVFRIIDQFGAGSFSSETLFRGIGFESALFSEPGRDFAISVFQEPVLFINFRRLVVHVPD